jgi:hypothetical protein
VANAWSDNSPDAIFSNYSLCFLILLNAAMRTAKDHTKLFEEKTRARSGSKDNHSITSAHPERSRSPAISTRMSERGKRVTRYVLFESQPSRCSRSDGNNPFLSFYPHHHPPCRPPPIPATPLCTSSLFTTHLRLRSHSGTTMARWVSGQRLSSLRGWPRSSTSLLVLK